MGIKQIFTRRSSKPQSQGPDVQSFQVQPDTRASLEGSRSKSPTTPLLQEELIPPESALNQSDALGSDVTASSLAYHGGHNSIDRPGTPISNYSGRQESSQSPVRSRRELRRPPVSFRKPNPASSILAADQNPAEADEVVEIDPVFSMTVYDPARSRSSIGSTRFKDLLDAQHDIRPIDFRSRLQAAGARDYGEDVADRNIAQNRGDELCSTPAAFVEVGNRTTPVSSSSTSKPRLHPADNPARQGPVPASKSTAEGNEGNAYMRSNREQRLSLNTYIPTGMFSPFKPRSANTSPILHEGIVAWDFALSGAKVSSAPRPYKLSPTCSNTSIPRASGTPDGTADHNDSLSEDQKVDETNGLMIRLEEDTGHGARKAKRSQYTASGSHLSLSSPNMRRSHQTVRSSLTSSAVASPYPSTDFTPLSCPRPRHDGKMDDTEGANDGPDDFHSETTRSPLPKGPRRRDSTEDRRVYHRMKALSLLSSSNEVKERISGLSRSIRHRAVSQGSKSESTANPNLYSAPSGWGPCSHHTASTSLYSTNQASLSCKSDVNSVPTCSNHVAASTRWSLPAAQFADFNLEKFTLSNDDCFTTARKRWCSPAECDEDLLFKAGYGVSGIDLPGLGELGRMPEYQSTAPMGMRSDSASSDGSAAVASSPKDNRFRADRETPSELLGHTHSDPHDISMRALGRVSSSNNNASGPKMSAAMNNGSGVAAAADFYTSLSHPLSGAEHEVNEETAARLAVKRVSAFGTRHGMNTGPFLGFHSRFGIAPVDETREGSGIGDTSDAIRIRKEEKTRMRASGTMSIKERRLTRAFGDLEAKGIARIMEQLEDEDEIWERGRTRDVEVRRNEIHVD